MRLVNSKVINKTLCNTSDKVARKVRHKRGLRGPSPLGHPTKRGPGRFLDEGNKRARRSAIARSRYDTIMGVLMRRLNR